MRTVSTLALALLMLTVLPARGAFADDDNQVVIQSASTIGNTLTIAGVHFGTVSPIVRVNGATLTVQANSETQITATMPTLAPGTYLLVVLRTHREGDRDEDNASRLGAFDLTIGGVGPQGPQGFQGPAGVQGLTGAAGATGAPGPQGLIGATGALGPQGLTGATGSQGSLGPKGDPGSVGLPGPQGSQGFMGATGAAGPTGPAG
ncbi:MAG TPA: IPT/TIG domain-containing protein, partial [Vicinamibacterales bacterium]|nr:IPT/TIG domain-containing protein [Vicinamibacterales bacterium]